MSKKINIEAAKTARVNIRLSPDEKRRLTELASNAEMSITEYILSIVLG